MKLRKRAGRRLGPTRLARRLVVRALFITCRIAFATPGATTPWITYEAEAMKTSGEVLGPRYEPHHVETESSGQRCVKLAVAGAYVEFTATAPANALVLRYSLPDSPQGGGTSTTVTLAINSKPARVVALTSKFSHLYGAYPFFNDPRQGTPRNFYDEQRVKDVMIARGDVVRLEKTSDDAVPCIIDLVDLEAVPPPLTPPPDALSVIDFGAGGKGVTDDTEALRQCIAAAVKEGNPVWVPAGDYRLTGDIIVPSSATIQGAGMWHTTFAGDENLYARADRRVRFKLMGARIRLADFAICGRLNYRNDDEPNDGIVGAGCSDSTVSRIWVEHTKVGAWIYNGTNLTIEGCRFRNLLADGVNLCVGTSGTDVCDCSARGTGDDCFAIWPVPSDQGFNQQWTPGNNVIRRCTGQLPFLANGAALYGGANNQVEECLFTDVTAGCGILISTTFPTADEAGRVDNNFSGRTVVHDCELVRCGGYDHGWAWRGSFQICLDHRSISGLEISRITIRDSLSSGLAIVAPGSAKGRGTLSNSVVDQLAITRVGLAAQSHALHIREHARGELRLFRSKVGDIQNDSKAFTIVQTED